jgi:hypothetical protein
VCWNLQGFPFGRCIISGHISTCFSCKRINYSWDLPNYIYSFGDPKYEITTKKKEKKREGKESWMKDYILTKQISSKDYI